MPPRKAKPRKKRPAPRIPTGRTGAPSIYTDALGARVCFLISIGRSLRQIEAMDGMPCKDTILEWVVKSAGMAARTPETPPNSLSGFSDQYVRARESYFAIQAEEIVEIADEERDPARAKVKIDARKWIASKLLRKRYGDRVQIDLPTPAELPEAINTVQEAARLLEDLLGQGLVVAAKPAAPFTREE